MAFLLVFFNYIQFNHKIQSIFIQGDTRDLTAEALAERPFVTNVDFKDSSLFDTLNSKDTETRKYLMFFKDFYDFYDFS